MSRPPPDMRRLIRLVETTFDADVRFQFHLSVEPDLVPGHTFASQTRTISSHGARGDAGNGEGEIYTTRNLHYWTAQLAYEIPDRRFARDFPRFVYLVYVKGGGGGTIDAAHQDMSPPDGVMVLVKLTELDPDPDANWDLGRVVWQADRWIRSKGAEVVHANDE